MGAVVQHAVQFIQQVQNIATGIRHQHLRVHFCGNAAASFITTLTPTPKDDAALAKVRQVLARLSALQPLESHRRFKLPLTRPNNQSHPDDLP